MFSFRRLVRKIKKAKTKLAIAMATMIVMVSPALAQDNESMSINWTAIGDIIEGAGSIMPSVGSLIVAVVPVLLVLIVVGFVTGLFDGIIGAIQDAFRMFRR